MSRESGFTLVELMIVTAILAILASVALPAYINYINRMNQGDAVAVLMNAKMDQEAFYENNGRYAGTIGCLPSCNKDSACLANCGACAQTAYTSGKGYLVSVDAAAFANTQNVKIIASRRFYSYRPTDILHISSTLSNPIVEHPDAIGFSLFKMLFD